MRFQPAAMSFAVSLAALSAGFALPAFAGSATQSEANRIEAALQGYFGKAPGVVSVTPEGDSYHLRIDPAPVLAKLPDNVKVSLTPLDYTLTDLGGGKWGTKLTDAPMSLKIRTDGPDAMEKVVSIAHIESTGTFDETLGAFLQSTTVATDYSDSQTSKVMGQPMTATVQKYAKITYTTTTMAGAHGLDAKINGSATGYSMSFDMTPPVREGAKPRMPVHITATAEGASQEMTAKGLRMSGILAFYRWVLDHPSGEQMKAAKAEMSPLVKAMLPLFDNIDGTGAMTGIQVTTPIGPVGLDKVSFKISANGVVPEGMVMEGFSLEGLHLPPGIVPPFAAPLVPQKAGLDVKVTGFDLATPAQILLAAMEAGEDINKNKEFDAKMLAALLPSGEVTVSTDNTNITGADYALTLGGTVQAGPASPMPKLDLLLTAKGFDKVMAALDTFPPQLKQQAVPMLMMARGFAKPEANGDMTWKIASSPEGHLLINGQDMGPMAGRRRPQP